MVLEGEEPVSGIDIHIRSNMKPGGFMQGEHRDVEIELNVSTSGVYLVDVYRLGSDQLVASVSDTLESGTQTLTIPDTLLTNGVYVYTLTTPLDEVGESNFLINKPDSALIYSDPLTTSNSAGEFEIDADYLAIDALFTRGEEQFEITDSLQVIAVRDSTIAGKGFIQVGEGDNFVEISID